jgi:hypothetical protein
MLNRILGYILTKAGLAAGAAAAALVIWWRAWTGGTRRERERQEARRAAELAKSQGKRLDKLNTAQEVRNATDARPDDDVSRRLRERWTRADD